ncbi:MAG: ABC transporter permease [Lentisphaeraceae bacterium]|nr:ABC transporter permease [Lentisphaeraceae bacterium]
MKEKLTSFLSEYGMILVLFLLMGIFSLVTLEEQPAEGYNAGKSLAATVKSQSPKSVILIVKNTSEDQQLKEGFEEVLKGGTTEFHVISANEPYEAKESLQNLQEKVPANTAIICSKQTGSWTFFNSVDHFKGSKITLPKVGTRSSFFSRDNLSSLPRKTSKTAIIAIGMTMVIITAGIDLSVGSLVALASVVATLMLQNIFGGTASGINISLAFLCAVAVCGFIGFLSGLVTTAFKIPAFIVTLAVMLIARGWAQNLSNNNTIKVDLPDWLGQGAVSISLMIFLYIIAYIVMHKTVIGRQIYAIGGNQEAARLSGVPVNRVLIIVYTLTGILAGIAGIVMTAELESGSGNFGETWELNVIAAVVVGGTSLMGGQGKVIGTLIGCAIIEVINNGMNLMGIGSNTQKVVLGIVILLAIIIDKFKKGEINWFSNMKRNVKSKDKGDINCLNSSTVKAS